MVFKNSPSSYAWPAQLLHWSVAALIVTQFILGKLAERAEDNEAKMAQLVLLANHKSVGITILMLALLRVGWRLLSPPPALPSTMPDWQILASKVSHCLLYLLIFTLPVTGWLMSSASAYTVSWFNLFELPDLVSPSKELKQTLQDVHHLLAEALFVVAALHIAAALKHHYFDKDDILKRMISPASLGVFAFLLTATLWSFAMIDTNNSADSNTSSEPKSVPIVQQDSLQTTAIDSNKNREEDSNTSSAPKSVPLVQQESLPIAAIDGNKNREEDSNTSSAPKNVPVVQQESLQTAAIDSNKNHEESTRAAWDIDYAASSIEFTAEQAGAKFTGVWPSWRADMFFDSSSLAQSKFDVQVDVTKVDSRDEERDTTLMEPEWFDAQKFPEARFVTREFKENSDGSFTAVAMLEIKDFGAPVELGFSIEDSAGKVTLKGNARLDRLALKVGTGEWTDLEWVSQYVDVKVHVEAHLAE
ncbi:MAG: cytochrome b/b6 domain-containing protein [Pseudomonadales bacterium]